MWLGKSPATFFYHRNHKSGEFKNHPYTGTESKFKPTKKECMENGQVDIQGTTNGELDLDCLELASFPDDIDC